MGGGAAAARGMGVQSGMGPWAACSNSGKVPARITPGAPEAMGVLAGVLAGDFGNRFLASRNTQGDLCPCSDTALQFYQQGAPYSICFSRN